MLLENNFFLIENYLNNIEVEELFELVKNNKENFVKTTTFTGDCDYRKSTILHHKFFETIRENWKAKLFKKVPEICFKLLIPEFEPVDFEMQLTRSGNSDFYKIHNDTGHESVVNREITFVYYFNNGKFNGGELQLYPTDTDAIYTPTLPDDNSIKIKPKHNTIIFFDSRLMHQVLKVIEQDDNFINSRFTLNGWLKS